MLIGVADADDTDVKAKKERSYTFVYRILKREDITKSLKDEEVRLDRHLPPWTYSVGGSCSNERKQLKVIVSLVSRSASNLKEKELTTILLQVFVRWPDNGLWYAATISKASPRLGVVS
jgi:hypothetical protein